MYYIILGILAFILAIVFGWMAFKTKDYGCKIIIGIAIICWLILSIVSFCLSVNYYAVQEKIDSGYYSEIWIDGQKTGIPRDKIKLYLYNWDSDNENKVLYLVTDN